MSISQENKALIEKYLAENKGLQPTSHLAWQIEHEFESLSDRKNMHGHLTASAMVINEKGQFMVIFHPVFQAWVQPGGHSEGLDIALSDTAQTEVLEETGFKTKLVLPYILDLDTHFIAPNPKKQEGLHYHHDSIFVLKADCSSFDPGRELSQEHIRWLSLNTKELENNEFYKDHVSKNRRLVRSLNKLNTIRKLEPELRNLW